mgnify:CR=1 FL=1
MSKEEVKAQAKIMLEKHARDNGLYKKYHVKVDPFYMQKSILGLSVDSAEENKK